MTFLSYNFYNFSGRGWSSSFVLVDDDVVIVDVVVSTFTGSFDLDFSLNWIELTWNNKTTKNNNIYFIFNIIINYKNFKIDFIIN